MSPLAVGAVLLAASPSASPTPGSTQLPRGLEPTDVTPGVAGFLATAFVVVLSIFLILNLVARMRRIRHRGALEEAREREAAARAGADGLPGAASAPGLAGGHPVVRGEVREEVPGRVPEEGTDRTGRDGPDASGRPGS